MDRSIEFYSDVFGLEVRLDVSGTFPGMEVMVGDGIDQTNSNARLPRRREPESNL